MNTLKKLNIKDSISEFIKQHIVLFDSFDNVYLFGSILDINKIPNDIDILLVYLEYSTKILNDLNYIRSVLEEVSGLPVDLTVLSVEEQKETDFLNRISSLYLKLK